MSATNWFETRKKAFKMREKDIDSTYTVRVGSVSDNFIMDRVVTITNPSAAFTITLPSGVYRGQRVLIVLKSNTGNKRATVTTAAGSNYKLQYNGQYVSLEWVAAGTNDGWIWLAKYAT